MSNIWIDRRWWNYFCQGQKVDFSKCDMRWQFAYSLFLCMESEDLKKIKQLGNEDTDNWRKHLDHNDIVSNE